MDDRWKKVEQVFQERFGKIPDMEGILFLIGMNELRLPKTKSKFSKEQKQDLMHVAVCTLLSTKGYYEFLDYDQDGWPHYVKTSEVPLSDLKDQESLLKECIIEYFSE